MSIFNVRVFVLSEIAECMLAGAFGLMTVWDCTVPDLIENPIRLKLALCSYFIAAGILLLLKTVGDRANRHLAMWVMPKEWTRFSQNGQATGFTIAVGSWYTVVWILWAQFVTLVGFAGLVADGTATWNGPPVLPLAVLLCSILAFATQPRTIVVRGETMEFTYWFGSWAFRMSEQTYLRQMGFGGSVGMTLVHPYIVMQNIIVHSQVLTDDGEEMSLRKALGQYFGRVQ